jgi:hypothetical protein
LLLLPFAFRSGYEAYFQVFKQPIKKSFEKWKEVEEWVKDDNRQLMQAYTHVE